jgi:hypothetical protein
MLGGRQRGKSVLESLSRRKRYAALAAVLVLGTACSEDPPAPDPIAAAPSTSTTPSATPSPSGPPTMPAEAKGTSRKSAVAFVRHYVDLMNHSASALDPEPLRLLSAEDCAACRRILRSVEEVRDAGGRFVGGAWTVAEPRIVPGVVRRNAQVQLVVTYPRQRVFETKGAQPLKFAAGKTFYTFTLVPEGETWTVAAIEGVA